MVARRRNRVWREGEVTPRIIERLGAYVEALLYSPRGGSEVSQAQIWSGLVVVADPLIDDDLGFGVGRVAMVPNPALGFS